ncbi:MAG: hypothetical protein GC168_20970 [Candidatus Hydrogenedens sp.]|nr:hypothetical protein [Candidatus Hydrogenedens sp.]
MDDEPQKPPVARTKVCPQCSKVISIDRFVCPECGYQYPWFKIRLYVGGCSVLLALIGLLLMALMNIMGTQ